MKVNLSSSFSIFISFLFLLWISKIKYMRIIDGPIGWEEGVLRPPPLEDIYNQQNFQNRKMRTIRIEEIWTLELFLVAWPVFKVFFAPPPPPAIQKILTEPFFKSRRYSTIFWTFLIYRHKLKISRWRKLVFT